LQALKNHYHRPMADAPLPRPAPARSSDRALSLPEPHTLSKRRALIELALGYSLILLVLWTPRPWQRPLYLLAALVIAAIFCIGYTTPQSMGLRTGNFFRSLWIVAIALLISSAAIGLAINFQTLHPVHGPIAF